MKRCLLSFFCIFALLGSNAYSQEKYSHWSLGLKGGVNRSEFSGGGVIGDAKYGFSLGAELEWTANPLWGLALDYEYIDYSCFDIDAHTNEFALLGSVNFANLLAKYRACGWQKLNAYGRIGAGLSFFGASTSGTTIVVPMGGALEYNVSKNLAFGIVGERRYHTSSVMGLGKKVQERAIIWSLMANVRIKFGSNHFRDMNMFDYENGIVVSERMKSDRNLSSLEQGIADNEYVNYQLKEQLNKANADLKKMSSELDKTKKDLDEATGKLLSYYKENPKEYYYSSPSEKITSIQAENIEFDFNSTSITSSSYDVLNDIANKMKDNPNLYLEILGHTDAAGGEEVNQKISIERADAVKDYIVRKGIDSKRITTQGMGSSKSIGDNATVEGSQKNRRVEFVFSNK